MSGLVCLFIGGAYNAYRIYSILSRGGDSTSVQLKGAVGGFVAGAIFFGLPMWAVFAVVSHVASGN